MPVHRKIGDVVPAPLSVTDFLWDGALVVPDGAGIVPLVNKEKRLHERIEEQNTNSCQS